MNAVFTKIAFTNTLSSKFTLLLALASGVAIVLSCAAFVANDVTMLRRSKVRELTSVAEVIASTSTVALAFGQADAAEELLKSLAGRSDITAAALFDSEGTLFASYGAARAFEKGRAENSSAPVAPRQLGHRFLSDGMLEVALAVVDQGERLGHVQLRATTSDLHHQMLRYSAIVASVTLASLLVAIALGTRMRRSVADPLLGLTSVVEKVTKEGDYATRVDKPANDEMGALYQAFNALLARVDFADAALQRANEDLRATKVELEEQVRLRTDQLRQVGSQLESSENQLRLIVASIRGQQDADLSRVLQVVNEQRDDLAGFMEVDPRGKLLPRELVDAGRALSQEHDAVLEKLADLAQEIEGIKGIVDPRPIALPASQRESYASA